MADRKKRSQWGPMAVDPTANATFIATHQLPLNVGDKEIIEGISETVVSITEQPAPGYQRVNLTVSLDIPGSAEGLALRPFGEGQHVFIKNDLGFWVEFNVRGATGNDLSLKPTTQLV